MIERLEDRQLLVVIYGKQLPSFPASTIKLLKIGIYEHH
jgi:hypothetical protein